MARNSNAGAATLETPEGLIDATEMVRQVHMALKCTNQLLSHAESGTQVDSSEIACVLMPLQHTLYGALDELDAMCRLGSPA